MANSIESLFSLEGKVAIVTGASRGIGEEIARVYTMAGAKVVICSRKLEEIKETAKRISNNDQVVLGVEADVSLPEDRQRLVKETIEWAGRIDILVNNAGGNPGRGLLAEVTEQNWDKTFDINLKACLLLSRSVYQSWMKEHGGSIINITSVGGLGYKAGVNAYGISKAAQLHLTRSLSKEWGHEGVRVNAIAPGLIRTELSRRLWDAPEPPAHVKTQPISRIGEVEDIGGAALFFASSASSFITGELLLVDGGQMLH